VRSCFWVLWPNLFKIDHTRHFTWGPSLTHPSSSGGMMNFARFLTIISYFLPWQNLGWWKSLADQTSFCIWEGSGFPVLRGRVSSFWARLRHLCQFEWRSHLRTADFYGCGRSTAEIIGVQIWSEAVRGDRQGTARQAVQICELSGGPSPCWWCLDPRGEDLAVGVLSLLSVNVGSEAGLLHLIPKWSLGCADQSWGLWDLGVHLWQHPLSPGGSHFTRGLFASVGTRAERPGSHEANL